MGAERVTHFILISWFVHFDLMRCFFSFCAARHVIISLVCLATVHTSSQAHLFECKRHLSRSTSQDSFVKTHIWSAEFFS